MARTIPSAVQDELEHRSRSDILLCFLTINHKATSDPVRVVCEEYKGVSYRSGLPINYRLGTNLYYALPFSFERITDDEGVPRAKLVVPNIDLRIGEALLAISEPARLTAEVYSYSDWCRSVDSDNARSPVDDEEVTNGTFDTDSGWTKGTGWTISSGKARHAAGADSDLTQTITLTAGRTYEVAYHITGMTAGAVTPRLTGGTTVTGTSRSSNGFYAERLTAASGNTGLQFNASSPCNAAIDNVSLREIITDADEIYRAAHLFLRSVKVDIMSIEGELTGYDISQEPWPFIRMTQDVVPDLYRQ